jgi:hypothetical protein
MPVFPSFMRRMRESSPAMTLGQRSPTPPLEPFRIQRPPTPDLFETQNDPPPVKSSADKIRETVASQIRYEDIAPKLEPIPETPAFKPKDKYGLVDRLKMMLGGAALGSQRGGGLGAIGGIIAGAVNPAGVDRHGYATYVRPQLDAEAQGAMARNKARMGNFESEMKARKTISEINQANAPEYAQATGSQYTLIFDKKSGRFIPAMDNGEPVEAASVVAGRNRDTTNKTIQKDNRKAAWDRLMETIQGRKDVAGMNIDARKTLAEFMQREAMKRLGISESGKDRRQKRQLLAEGYDLSEGAGTGAGTGPARPGGAGSADPIKNLIEQLKRSGKFLGPVEDNEDEDDFWY